MIVPPTTYNTLVLIPARAGSKGVVHKNVKPFDGGDSLVERAIAVALAAGFSPDSIIVSTDDEQAIHQATTKGVTAHRRPAALATDDAGMQAVMLDAIQAFGADKQYLLLLQPTSPLRKADHLQAALAHWQAGDEAVVAMHRAKAHPLFTLFEYDGNHVKRYADGQAIRRQDLPPLLQVNGLLYLFALPALRAGVWTNFARIRPLLVEEWEAIDIDTPQDWWLAELVAQAMRAGRGA